MIRVARLDHLVLTVASIEASLAFYGGVLGMAVVTFGEGRKALRFGAQQINLHEVGREFEPKASRPTPGSADLCFIVATPLSDVAAHLEAAGVAIELGPVPREGAAGAFASLYLRDPDGNLVELSEPGRPD
ncbi:VOC family protein [Mesorhizobium sp. BR1-1-16]|uniref:VOC family protein n=1 Tax=Mesorhizobium sp. BR1-1-16 TaxID=2876653 RepID=UPI001CCFD680|nr:VOC family protein [Mesorhizobium sp. BR1-1-16]MBZ9937071.1 VOC family protein [Mesorhizobium sp. BR1-1-16]